MEHILLEGIGISLGSDSGVIVIEYALEAGACGTYVSARITSDTTRELFSPVLESFVCCHLFKLCDLGESVSADCLCVFFIDYDGFVCDLMILTLAAETSFKKELALIERLIAVKCIYSNSIAVINEAYKTCKAFCSDLIYVKITCALNAYDIELFSYYSVLTDKSIERVSIAGLCEYEYLAFLSSLTNEVL